MELSEVKTLTDQILTEVHKVREYGEKLDEAKISKAEFQSTVDKIKADMNAQMDKVEALVKTPALQKAQADEFEAKDRAAFNGFVRDYKAGKGMLIFNPERKELGTDIQTTGGYRTLKTLSGKILENLFEIDPIRANANVEPPISGDVWQAGWDDNVIATSAVEEGGTRAETAVDTIGLLEIPVRERFARPITTQRMLDMADFDVEAWLQKKLSRKFGYQEAYDFLLGDGISSPEGLLTNAVLTAAAQHSGQAAALPAAASFDLFFTGMAGVVKMGYHGGAKWYMNRTTLFKMLTYKYADGKYILQMAMNPGKLVDWAMLGYPVIECPSWPSEGAGNMVMGFGNLSETYTIIDNPKMTILRDPYSTLGKVGFYTTRYYGGKVVKTESFKLMECAA